METIPIERIIELLVHVQRRPGMYFGSNSQHISPFLYGFRAACHVFGYEYSEEQYQQLLKERGWDVSHSISLPTYLIEQGRSFEFIAEETLQIEIVFWRKVYQTIKQEDDSEIRNKENSVKETEDTVVVAMATLFPLQPREGWYWNRIEHHPVHLKQRAGVWTATTISPETPNQSVEKPLTPGLFELLSFLEVHPKPQE